MSLDQPDRTFYAYPDPDRTGELCIVDADTGARFGGLASEGSAIAALAQSAKAYASATGSVGANYTEPILGVIVRMVYRRDAALIEAARSELEGHR